MNQNDLLKDKAIENQQIFMDWLKKAITLKYGSISAFCRETGIYSPSQWAGIFAGDKRPGLAEILASIDCVGGSLVVALPDGLKRNIVGEFAGDVPMEKQRSSVKAQPANFKEAAQMARDEAREREKAEKERRKLWHKDRKKILPDPETNEIGAIHGHLMAMIPVLRDLLGPGAQGIFDLHMDKFNQLAYWITSQGYPHVRIPDDLSQCGEPAFHFNQYVMYSLYKIKPEMVRYATPDEIHYYYNSVFLPQKRILETMLESGVEIESGYHFFGGKKCIYPKNSHPIPGATQSTPDGFRIEVGAPFHPLKQLGWDYAKNQAIENLPNDAYIWSDVFDGEHPNR